MRIGKLLRRICAIVLIVFLFYPAGLGLSSDSGMGPLYYTYSQFNEDVQALAEQYPEIVSVSVQGKSATGRNIWSVTVGKGSKNILITGALHASEWITAPVLLETIAAYAQEYSQGALVQGESMKHILDTYSLTFLPMVNPDGVTLVLEGASAFPGREAELIAMNPWEMDFSRWKANIRGVDLNRNFNVRWGEPVTETLATQPAYAFYAGPYPESEPETRVVAEWVRDNAPELLLDYHSYGEVLFWYYLQSGDRLERDKTIVEALRDYSGYWMENVDPSILPSPTSTYWGSAVMDIPSICVEVGDVPPHLLTMADVPDIISQAKYLPLVAIMNLPDYQSYVPVRSVSLPGAMTVTLGSVRQLSAAVYPAGATNKELAWSSSDSRIVSVDSQGTITALNPGKAVITAAALDGGQKAATEITVYRALPRLKDANRYSTAVKVSQVGWTSADTVVLARGDDFADGLAGVPLAHQLGAPLLLTRTGTLPASAREEISRLGAKTAYILGGTGAIAQSVEDELSGMGLETVRISGRDRFDTAVQIAGLMNPADTAVLAYGLNFPDALSVASHAAVNGYPILLTRQQDLPAATAGALAELGIKNTIVAGGSAAVSDSVLTRLPNPTRVKGANRYATAVEIAQFFDQDSAKVYIASGLDFADALTGAALAAREGTGILLSANYVPLALEDYLCAATPEEVVLLGGSAAVSTQVEIELSALLEQLKEVIPK